jgi:hypothetical protein
MTKADLIARLEKEGGSRFPTSFTDDLTRAIFGAECTLDDWGLVNDAVNYGDLNAAIALCERVLPGPGWGVSTTIGRERFEASVVTLTADKEYVCLAHGKTAATALCIAILEALSALEDGK